MVPTMDRFHNNLLTICIHGFQVLEFILLRSGHISGLLLVGSAKHVVSWGIFPRSVLRSHIIGDKLDRFRALGTQYSHLGVVSRVLNMVFSSIELAKQVVASFTPDFSLRGLACRGIGH